MDRPLTDQVVDPHAQADPKFQTPFACTRITAAAVRKELMNNDELKDAVPCRQTVGEILNRMGYRLRRVHDMGQEALLIPLGILEIARGQTPIDQLWLTFGTSRETSDFVADALDRWWQQRSSCYTGVNRLQIELDNGPEINSSRTQFMKRLRD